GSYTSGLPIIVTRPAADTVVTFTGTVSKGTAPVVSQPVIVKVTVKGTAATSSNGSLTATVSFANPSQPTISFSKGGTAITSAPVIYTTSDTTAATLTVTAPTGFSSYLWKLDGTTQSSTSNSITVSASSPLLLIGKHRLWLAVLSGNYAYNAYVTFEVRY
ncbi:MAG: hypothetical protein WCQ50_19295, partial [Spirochaetota bacterium]